MAKTIKCFHGSGTSIDRFSYDFTEIGNDQLGSGFYFTTDEHEAYGYCFNRLNGDIKPGGMLEPTLHSAELTFDKVMPNDHQMVFKREDIKKIIQASPVLAQQIEANWGEIAFEGLPKLLNEAVNAYQSGGEKTSAIKTFNQLSNDFYPGHPEAFFRVINDMYGFDGVVASFKGFAGKVGEKKHYVAWFPDQIKITNRISAIQDFITLNEEHDEDPVLKGGMALFHGTAMESALDIMHHGIDFSKTSMGYFGNGFYTATQCKLAKSNYADMADDELPGAIVVMELKTGSRILDLRTEDDFHIWQTGKYSNMLHLPDFDAIMRKNKIDGVYDRSFGGLVIYNANAVNILGVTPESAAALHEHMGDVVKTVKRSPKL